MTESDYRYRPEVLQALEQYGIRPHRETPPSVAYDLLKSIYTFEVRDLRVRRREMERVLGPQPIESYRRQLHALLDRYPILRVPAHHWVE